MAVQTHPTARVIAQLLVDLGVCSRVYSAGRSGYAGPGWPAAVNAEPASPDDVVTVYDADGPNFGVLQTDGQVTGFDGFQLRVRSGDYAAGHRKARQIVDALSALHNRAVTVETSTYLVGGVGGLENILRLGADKPASARQLFTINADADLTER